MNIREFYRTDYRVSFVSVMRQTLADLSTWSCMGVPKRHHLFVYLDGCTAHYRMKSGKEIRACAGDFLHIPAGCEYRVSFFESDGCQNAATVGINFDLFDSEGIALSEPDGITVHRSADIKLLVSDIERLTYSVNKIPAKYNVLIYEMFNLLGDAATDEEYRLGGFDIIRPGVEYLFNNYRSCVSVGELAGMCNVSEVYFRRLFSRHVGFSPVEYVRKLRLERATLELRYTDMPISEIAEKLGFVDTSYFVKLFKARYGITPLTYRKIT